MNGYRLDEATIGNAKVVVDILPKGYCIPDRKLNSIGRITIHNTGNNNATAKNNHDYMKNINRSGERKASWHFTVDDVAIYQAQSCNFECWHAGNSNGNKNSVGIEIAQFTDASRQHKAYLNAIELVKILMKGLNLGIDKVVQHNYWSGKDCPQLLRANKFGYNWAWFINQCKNQPSNNSNHQVSSEGYANGTYNMNFKVNSSDGALSVRDARPNANGDLGNKLGELKTGDLFKGGYCLNNWMGLIFNGKQGFVNAEYIDADRPQIPSTSKPFANGDYKGVEMRVKVDDHLNIRKGRPNQANYGTVLGKLKPNQIVEVHYCLDGWFSIYIDGVCNPGYISGEYLELV